jgi:putative transposase
MALIFFYRELVPRSSFLATSQMLLNMIITDKAPSIGSAFKKIQKKDCIPRQSIEPWKYLNNLIEQDYRPIKRSLRTISATIKGMKTIRRIYKKIQKEYLLFGFFCIFLELWREIYLFF